MINILFCLVKSKKATFKQFVYLFFVFLTFCLDTSKHFVLLFAQQVDNMFMTYTLKLTPTGMALLEGYCRAAGRTLKDALGLHLTETAAIAPAATAATAATAPTAEPEALPSPAPRIQPPPPFAPPVPASPAEEDAILANLGA